MSKQEYEERLKELVKDDDIRAIEVFINSYPDNMWIDFVINNRKLGIYIMKAINRRRI